MTAPGFTVRQTPLGKKLTDPFPTTFAFADDPDISIWEQKVTPFGFDVGDPIELTDMHNVEFRTKAARVLKDTTAMKVSGHYDARLFAQTEAILGTEQAITIHHPNGDQVAFWGYLKSFTPQDNEENGDAPMADFEIIPTNTDPSSGAEEGPAYTYTPASGS